MRAAERALVLVTLLAVPSCRAADPVEQQKTRALTADERYLVDYYMKIIQFEKQHYDNPALREEKKKELAAECDRERIEKTVAKLEKKPERWLAIYNRINELQIRELQNPTGQD